MLRSEPAGAPAARARALGIVVLGVDGARGDAQVGGRVVDMLRGRLPDGVRLLRSATVSRDFAELDGATHVLVIDCVDVGRSPGAVVLFDAEMLTPCVAQVTFREKALIHHLVLAGQHSDAPEEVALLGIQAFGMDGDALSPQVEAAVPALVEEATAVVAAWLDDRAPQPGSRTEAPEC